MQGSKKPFSKAAITKCECVRCGKPARFQWNACSDDNTWRPLCEGCDVELNVVVLRWMGFKDWRAKIKRYCKIIGVKWSEHWSTTSFKA